MNPKQEQKGSAGLPVHTNLLAGKCQLASGVDIKQICKAGYDERVKAGFDAEYNQVLYNDCIATGNW